MYINVIYNVIAHLECFFVVTIVASWSTWIILKAKQKVSLWYVFLRCIVSKMYFYLFCFYWKYPCNPHFILFSNWIVVHKKKKKKNYSIIKFEEKNRRQINPPSECMNCRLSPICAAFEKLTPGWRQKLIVKCISGLKLLAMFSYCVYSTLHVLLAHRL